jgi:hypothetical protein
LSVFLFSGLLKLFKKVIWIIVQEI